MENKEVFWYNFRLLMIRFLLLGFVGYGVEIWYTSIYQFIKDPTQHIGGILGHTHVAAVLLYGFASVIYTFMYEPLMKVKLLTVKFWGPLLRYTIYALSFMVLELITGLLLIWIVKTVPGETMWDYRGRWGNIMGLTTFSMFPAWFLAAMAGEFIHKRLLAIDDILLNFDENFNPNTKENRAVHLDNKIRQKRARKEKT